MINTRSFWSHNSHDRQRAVDTSKHRSTILARMKNGKKKCVRIISSSGCAGTDLCAKHTPLSTTFGTSPIHGVHELRTSEWMNERDVARASLVLVSTYQHELTVTSIMCNINNSTTQAAVIQTFLATRRSCRGIRLHPCRPCRSRQASSTCWRCSCCSRWGRRPDSHSATCDSWNGNTFPEVLSDLWCSKREFHGSFLQALCSQHALFQQTGHGCQPTAVKKKPNYWFWFCYRGGGWGRGENKLLVSWQATFTTAKRPTFA